MKMTIAHGRITRAYTFVGKIGMFFFFMLLGATLRSAQGKT
jgi:hypothetical protein